MLLTTGVCNSPASADALHNYLRYSGHHPEACVSVRRKVQQCNRLASWQHEISQAPCNVSGFIDIVFFLTITHLSFGTAYFYLR